MDLKKGWSKNKIIGVSGSPRDKNTNYMLQTVLDAAGKDYELVLLKDKRIRPCAACGGCFRTHKCVVEDDMRELYGKLEKADIIILASPTYFSNVSGLMKNFMDRCLPLYLSETLKGKISAQLAVGNFKKDEVGFLDNFDIEKAMQDPDGRRKLEGSVQRCLDIMDNFCVHHMGMKKAGGVIAINGDPQSKEIELVGLGKKLAASGPAASRTLRNNGSSR